MPLFVFLPLNIGRPMVLTSLQQRRMKKATSSVLLFSLVFQTFGIGWVYASPANFSSTLDIANRAPQTQVIHLMPPRELIAGDVLTLTVDGLSLVQNFAISSSTTLSLLALQINSLPTTTSTVEGNTIVVKAKTSGQAIDVSSLTLTRSPLAAHTTRNNVVAVAQKIEFSLPQTLIAGDVVALTISGNSITQPFVNSDSETLAALVAEIEALPTVDALLDANARKITVSASQAGHAFSISSIITTSASLQSSEVQPNIAPVAQVNSLPIPRSILPQESLTLSLNGVDIVQSYTTDNSTTLTSLAAQISSQTGVTATMSGSEMMISSTIPGTPFALSPLTYTGGTLDHMTIKPNIVAVKQQDTLTFPRALVLGDYISAVFDGNIIMQEFVTDETTTIAQFVQKIVALGRLDVTYNPLTRTITLTALSAGSAFSVGQTSLLTTRNSINTVANREAAKQVNTIAFPREFRAGDLVSFVINGNTISQSFATSHTGTLAALATQINAMSSIVATTQGTALTLTSATAGVGFSLSSASILNTLLPTTLIQNKDAVKQKSSFALLPPLLMGDSIMTTINGMQINQPFDTDDNTTLTAFNQKIDDLWTVNSLFTSSNRDFSVEANTGGVAFTTSDVIINSLPFSGATLTGSVSETKASATLSIDAPVATGSTLTLGQCTINFGEVSADTDTDCSDNVATLDVSNTTSLSLAALLRGISGIADANNGYLAASGSGNTIVYTTSGIQDTTEAIFVDNQTAGSITTSTVAPQVAVAQVDQLVLPRAFSAGDRFTTKIDNFSISQNFSADATLSLLSLVEQIDALPQVEASVNFATRTITITAAHAGVPFALGQGKFLNITTPTLTVSNTVAVAQQDILPFPTFVAGDSVSLLLNGTPIVQAFTGSSSATRTALVAQMNGQAGILASETGENDILVTSTNAGTPFHIQSVSLSNNTTSTPISPNVVAVAQVDSLALPYELSTGNSLLLNLAGHTLNQDFSQDTHTTLSLLSTTINSLSEVTSSIDASGALVVQSKNAGVPFTNELKISGPSFTSQNVVPNVEAQAQVEKLSIPRALIAGDTLEVSVAGSTFTASFSGSMSDTLTTLAATISSGVSALSTVADADGLTFTALTAGTPFATASARIWTAASNQVVIQNVVAQQQINQFTIPRTLVVGDTLQVSVDNTPYGQSFTGSTQTTLDALAAAISTSTGVLALATPTTLTLKAKVAGVPFATSTLALANGQNSATLQDNVEPVKQVDEFTLPLLVTGDTVHLTLAGTGVSTTFTSDDTTTVGNLLQTINNLNIVDATFDSQTRIVRLESKIAGLPFATQPISIVNTTPIQEIVANISPIAQVVTFVPQDTEKGLTFRATINGVKYDYLTQSGSTVQDIVTSLSTQIASNTGVLVSANVASTAFTVRAATAGVAFDYDAAVMDITPPIISTPIATAQTLKSGSVSTSNVESNENGTIYVIASGTTATTLNDIVEAMAHHDAGIAINSTQADTATTFTVPAALHDGEYNFVATDNAGNVSQVIPGWLTVDNLAPALSINGLPTSYSSADTFELSGSTEPNTALTVSGSVSLQLMSDASGNFATGVTLNQDSANVFDITATDIAENTTSKSIVVNQEHTAPTLAFSASGITKELSYTLSGSSNAASYEITASGNVVASGSIANGVFAPVLPLVANTDNTFEVLVSSRAGIVNSGSVVITQDTLTPNLILNPTASTTTASSVVISGKTESDLLVSLANGATTASATSDQNGNFSATVALTPNTVNQINVVVADKAGNSSSKSVLVIQETDTSKLVLSTPTTYTKENSITITGSVAPNTLLNANIGALTQSGYADNSGLFSFTLPLVDNTINHVVVNGMINGEVQSATVDIVQDMLAPALSVDTPSFATTLTSLVISGKSENGATIAIQGNSGTTVTIANANGDFSVLTPLALDVRNQLVITATDRAGNSTSVNREIMQGNIAQFLDVYTQGTPTKELSVTLSGKTKSGSVVEITGGSGVTTITADGAGLWNTTVPLNADMLNALTISATDPQTTQVATKTLTFLQDSIAPSITLEVSNATTRETTFVLKGTTESNSALVLNYGSGELTGSADGSGAFILSVPLILDSQNIINITATDAVGNTGSIVASITQDSLSPTISNLSATPQTQGATMALHYSLQTDENTAATFFVGTGANVEATLVASGSSNGLTHSGVIGGLLSAQTYYYMARAYDAAGNVVQSTVVSFNSGDQVGPALTSALVSATTATSADFAFHFSDAHLSASGSANLSLDGGTTIPLVISSGSIDFSATHTATGLVDGTTHDYALSFTDDFGNASSYTGTFSLPKLATIGSSTSFAGPVYVDGLSPVSLSGTTISILADSTHTGSLVLANIPSISYTPNWNHLLFAPSLVDSNSGYNATAAELATLAKLNDTVDFAYSATPFATYHAGALSGSIVADSGNFIVNIPLSRAVYGVTFNLYRSADGATWEVNTPDATCKVGGELSCTFTTNHLTYFALTTLSKVDKHPFGSTGGSSGGGGGGGAALSTLDYCPDGDYSSSYYDKSCGIKPKTASGSTSTGTISHPTQTIVNPVVIQVWQNVVAKVIADAKVKAYLDGNNAKMPLATKITVVNYANAITKTIAKQNATSATKKAYLLSFVNVLQEKIADSKGENEASVWQLLIDSLENKAPSVPTTPATPIIPTKPVVPATPIIPTVPTAPVVEPTKDTVVVPTKPATTTVKSNKKRNSNSTEMVEMTSDIYKYVGADHALSLRSDPAFKDNIIDYIPRNARVKLGAFGANWSRVEYNSHIGYVRTLYLRDETTQDRQRADTEIYKKIMNGDRDFQKKRVKVSHSVFVRGEPDPKSPITGWLYNGDEVVVLDSVDGWSEVRWDGSGKGFINNHFLEDIPQTSTQR